MTTAPHPLKTLLESQSTAALATLHKGDPAVSMVPYALLPGGRGFVIHVSGLATHTADMRRHPQVGLLVTAPPGSAESPRALARASIQGRAAVCAEDAPDHAEARALYLARFPDSEMLFSFADFSLMLVTVRSVRWVGGFGDAHSFMADRFAALMEGGPGAQASRGP